MKNRRNFYRILQVQPDAPAEIIRASFRTLMRELKQHPDLGGSTGDASLLNEAYEVLSNPDRRAAYDQTMGSRYPRRAAPADKHTSSTASCPVCKNPLAQEPLPGECCPTCQSPLQSEPQTDHGQKYERALARTKRNEPIFYQSSWPGKAQRAWMVDFSPNGMRFLCSERLAPGTVLKISGPLFAASAAVTNLREEIVAGDRFYAVGVAFLAVSFNEPRGTILSTSA